MIKCEGFHPKGYCVPAFYLTKGHFLRIWVELAANPTLSVNIGNGYKLIPDMIRYLSGRKRKQEIILTTAFSVTPKIKEGFIRRRFFPQTVSDYLIKNGLHNPENIMELTQFNINPDTYLKSLDFRLLLLFEIYIGLKKSDTVIFNYAGLGPGEEKLLTSFVKKQLHLGKTVVGIDNLNFISDIDNAPNIINLKITRI